MWRPVNVGARVERGAGAEPVPASHRGVKQSEILHYVRIAHYGQNDEQAAD